MSETTRKRKEPQPTPPLSKRIETQIHRRRKVKATFPLEAEWEADSGRAPAGLRMPEQKMKK